MRHLRIRQARNAAVELIEAYGIDRPEEIQVEDIAWDLGAQIRTGSLNGSLARLSRLGDRARIRLSDRNTHPGQRRFSIAHELGHLVLRHSQGLDICKATDFHSFGRNGEDDYEAEANTFAAEVLLPEKLVRRLCEVSPVNLPVVEEIAERFMTSTIATAIRFAELTSERCAAVLCQQRKVRWAVRSPSFWPEIPRGKPVMPWSVAHEYFAEGEVPADCEPVDATSWVDGEYLRGPAEIYEHAKAIPEIDAVLSLVWIPESCSQLACRVP